MKSTAQCEFRAVPDLLVRCITRLVAPTRPGSRCWYTAPASRTGPTLLGATISGAQRDRDAGPPDRARSDTRANRTIELELADADDATVLDAATSDGCCLLTENVRDIAVLARHTAHAGLLLATPGAGGYAAATESPSWPPPSITRSPEAPLLGRVKPNSATGGNVVGM